MARLQPPAEGDAILLACLDGNGDQVLDGRDRPELRDAVIPLRTAHGCLPPRTRREWFASSRELRCDGDSAPALIVAVAGGGSDLLDTNEGVSAGLIDIVNGIRSRVVPAGVETGVVISTAAIKDADLPQSRMEEWLVAELREALLRTPCLRAVVIGHSHGAVVTTTVLARLEAAFGERLFGVLLDRSLLYYDHAASELPAAAAMLNVFQKNEGWHGEPLDTPNVTNVDASGEQAPKEPRNAPAPLVAVAHSTLDDAAGVQEAIALQVLAWLLVR